MKNQCKCNVETFSRVVGFMTPVQIWNKGKQEEFKDRKIYCINRLPLDKIVKKDYNKINEN